MVTSMGCRVRTACHGQCSSAPTPSCGHEVARELDGYENRRQAVLFVGVVGCSRDFGQSRVQTLPVAQTEADILSVRVNAALLEGDIDDFTRRRRQNDGRVGGNTDIRPGNAHFGKQCAWELSSRSVMPGQPMRQWSWRPSGGCLDG